LISPKKNPLNHPATYWLQRILMDVLKQGMCQAEMSVKIHTERGIEQGDWDSLEQKIVLHSEPCIFDLLLKLNSLCANDLGETYRLY
jgi:hypothetical protein